MSKFQKIQEEIIPWQQHNFPGRDTWMPLVGLGEELGELEVACDSISSKEQLKDIYDAIGDCIIYLADFCNGMGFSLREISNLLPTIDFRGPIIISLGKLNHSFLKLKQRIRMNENHQENAKEAIRNILGYLNDKIYEFDLGESLEAIAWEVWEEVKQRDWQKSPNKDHENIK